MKKAKKTRNKKTAKKSSFGKAVKSHLAALEKQTRQKRGEIGRLMKKEASLEAKIANGLQKLVQDETKKLAKAKKNKDKNRKKFSANINAFKKKHQEFLRKNKTVERLRSRQKPLQQRIEKIKKFVYAQAPKVAAEQQKEMRQTIRETIAEPSVPVAETEEKAPEEEPAMEIEIEHETEAIPITAAEEENQAPTEEETSQPTEEETREKWSNEPTREEAESPTEEQPSEEAKQPAQPEPEPGFKQFASNGISFIHPDWPESATPSAEAIFSVEMNQTRFELIRYPADAGQTMEQNTQKALQSVPETEIVSQESINHYVFVTYLVTEGENMVKHYALFAQTGNQLYKIEANGDPDKLDEQSALIVKVFKSFAVEENE